MWSEKVVLNYGTEGIYLLRNCGALLEASLVTKIMNDLISNSRIKWTAELACPFSQQLIPFKTLSFIGQTINLFIVSVAGPVCQKSGYLSGPFWVSQFLLYLHNSEALSHQTLQSSWFFIR